MGRPRLNKKVKQTRESKYYGIPIRVKPTIVSLVDKLDPSKKAFNTKLALLLDELQKFRKGIFFKKIPEDGVFI